ncbi:MAG: TIGR03905 family TSCPD domain-containing protein [Oscillospiraceae bacterium]|nr:TIGR03905 family TSCPD domain-containing protein [Oscillospiraceae bacterium]
MRCEYKTENTCAQFISFNLEGNVVTDIEFYWGCNGNLKALAKLLDGSTVETIEEKLLGNTCGRRSTSCADQLAKAVRKVYNEIKQEQVRKQI